jgi:hypothetical protein
MDARSSLRLALTIAGLALSVGSASSAASAGVPRLLPLSSEQVIEAGAEGAGCSWSLPGDKRPRFAGTDDRAAVRLASGVVVLSPGAGARDLGRFTLDRWTGEGLTIRIVETGPARHRGGSVAEGPARLELRVRGTLRRLHGVLSCGS